MHGNGTRSGTRRIIRPEPRRWEFSDLYCHISADLHAQIAEDRTRTGRVFIEHATPILYFGLLPSRACRVVTVANNPSFGEFPTERASEPAYRFAHSGELGLIPDLSRVSPPQADSALKLMESYFHRDGGALVYRPFFGRFDRFLSGLGMGTYRNGTAAHTDVAMPYATTASLRDAERANPQSANPSSGVDWHDLYTKGLTWFFVTLALCPNPKVIVGIGKHGFEVLEQYVEGWDEPREVEPGVSAYFGRLTFAGRREVPIVWGCEPDRWFPRQAMGFGTEDSVEQLGRGVARVLRDLRLVEA